MSAAQFDQLSVNAAISRGVTFKPLSEFMPKVNTIIMFTLGINSYNLKAN